MSANELPLQPQKVLLAGGCTAYRSQTEIRIERPGQPAQIVWRGTGQLRGDPGERQGQVARFEDLDADGTLELVVGTVYEPVRLCGSKELPLLSRLAYDPQTATLRPIHARRNLATPVAATLRPTLPATPFEGRTLALAESVSVASGTKEDLTQLVGPFSLTDQNPLTGWIATEGDGRGEFATFRLPAGPYPLMRVGIRAALTREPRTARQHDRPKSLLLALADRAYRLEFADDPAKHPDEMVWFELPEPVASSCASLIVESSFEPGKNKHLAVADVTLVTLADGKPGLTRLVADLGTVEHRRAAAAILERGGKSAAQAVSQRFDSFDGQSRVIALRVLAITDAAGSMSRLVDAALAPDELLRQVGLAGLNAAPQPAAAELTRRLSVTDPAQVLAAIIAVSNLPAPLATAALLTRAGLGDRPQRRALRQALGQTAARSSQAMDLLQAELELPNPADDIATERRLDVLRAALGLSALRPAVVNAAQALAHSDTRFATAFRLLEVAEALGCDAPAALAQNATTHQDPAVRAMAIHAASQCVRPLSHQLVLEATIDPEVVVRLAAWDALSRAPSTAQPRPELLSRFAEEPWPAVKQRIAGCAIPEHPEARSLLTAAVADPSPGVRVAALSSLARHREPFATDLVEARLADSREKLSVRAAAAKSAGKRCQASAAEALFKLLKRGAEPLANRDEIEAALAAATALGSIGTPQARAYLEKAKRRSNPVTDRAIKLALASEPRACFATTPVTLLP